MGHDAGRLGTSFAEALVGKRGVVVHERHHMGQPAPLIRGRTSDVGRY